MNQGSSTSTTPIAPRPSNFIEYILRLENENTYLRNRIDLLERELQTEISQHALDNACSNQTINTLLQENLSLQNQLNQINHEISVAAEMIDNSQDIFAESIQDQSNIRGEVTPTLNII